MKAWFKSKTVWLGLLTTASGIFSLLAEYIQGGKLDSLEGWFLFGAGVLGVVLRIWFTSEAIE